MQADLKLASCFKHLDDQERTATGTTVVKSTTNSKVEATRSPNNQSEEATIATNGSNSHDFSFQFTFGAS
jgi:hypothetical protein